MLEDGVGDDETRTFPLPMGIERMDKQYRRGLHTGKLSKAPQTRSILGSARLPERTNFGGTMMCYMRQRRWEKLSLHQKVSAARAHDRTGHTGRKVHPGENQDFSTAHAPHRKVGWTNAPEYCYARSHPVCEWLMSLEP